MFLDGKGVSRLVLQAMGISQYGIGKVVVRNLSRIADSFFARYGEVEVRDMTVMSRSTFQPHLRLVLWSNDCL